MKHRICALFAPVLLTTLFAVAVPLSAHAQQESAAAPVAPGTTSDDSPEMKSLQKVEDSWSGAVNQRDQYGLELVLSPLFVDISAAGIVTTRNQQVAQIVNADDKSLSLDQRVVTVRMLGDVAVANGSYTLHHKGGSGPVVEKGVFTHVFSRTRGNWVCVNSQRTLIQAEGPASDQKKKKESKAELPLHIPFFSKSDKANQNQ